MRVWSLNRYPALRTLVAALSVLLVGSYVLSSLHFALVRHTLCAVHGELMHEDAEHADHAAPSVFGSKTGVLTSEIRTHSEHEHCSLPCRIGNDHALLAAHSAQIADNGRDAPGCPASSSPHVALDILQLAPKQSPPLHA